MRIAATAALVLLAACHPKATSDAAAFQPARDGGAAAAGISDLSDPKTLLAEVDRLKDDLKDKPKTFEVLSALGNLYYENGRYLDAADTFRQALVLAAPFEEEAGALRKKGVQPAPDLPLECRRSGPTYGLAEIAVAARKLDPPHDLRCLDAALEIGIAARSRRGNALYLVGSPDAALAEHQRVLARSADYPESLFFVGAILLEQSRGDKAKLAEGKKFWSRLLEVAPDHPRAALVKESLPRADEIFAPREPPPGPQAAQGASGLPAGHPAIAPGDGASPAREGAGPGAASAGPGGALPSGHPSISGNQGASPMAHAGPTQEEVANVADAVRGTERTPALEKGLDDLTVEAEKLLDDGKYQEARDAIVRVMPMRPDDARTAADMGAAMRGLGRAEMAERVLGRALQLDPRQPRALLELGRLYAQKGDKGKALETLRAVQAADAKFAAAHKVPEEISRLQ